MKANTTFIFAGIMSAIIGNAFAAGGNIITSKSYVDNALEQKQNMIEAYDANNEYRSVLTDTTEDGVVGKIPIVTAAQNTGDPLIGWEGVDDMIPTVGMVADAAQSKIPEEDEGLFRGQQAVTGMRAVLAPTDTAGGINQIGLWDADDMDATSWDLNSAYSEANEREAIRRSIPTVGAVEVGLNELRNNIPTLPDVLTTDGLGNIDWDEIGWEDENSMVPTIGAVDKKTQSKIAASKWEDNGHTTIPGVVISTDADGVVAQRMILETNDITDQAIDMAVLSGADIGHIAADIHSNSVTVEDVNNAVPTTEMTIAIANAAANRATGGSLPWQTAENNATGAYSTTFANSGTNVWPTEDATRSVKGETFAKAMATKQNRMTCAGWPDSVAVVDRTDANCWLWNKN